MDAADDTSETMSEASLYSKRSLHSIRPPGTPGTPGTRNNPSRGKRPGSTRGGSIRGGDEAVSDVSRDVGGLDMEGWDEKFVYKVSFVQQWCPNFDFARVPVFLYILYANGRSVSYCMCFFYMEMPYLIA